MSFATKAVKVLEGGVVYKGKRVEIGDVIELPPTSADALVDEDKAEYVESQPAGGHTERKTPTDLPNTPTNTQNAHGGNQTVQGLDAQATADALDKQYTLPELKEAAKTADVDFRYDDNKPQVIQAIIDQGKAPQLLK